MGNTRNTGYLQNIVQYDASNNITLPANLTVTGSIVGYATTSYVTTQINNLINGAPGALDTLNELAAALGNDASFAATLTTSLSGKQASLSGTGFVKSTAGTISYDTSTYLTTASATSTYLPLAGGTLTGNLYLLNANTRISSDGNGEVGLNYGTTTTSTYTFSLYNNITRTVGFTASGSAVFSSTISSTRINFPSNAYAYISEEYGLRLNMGGDTSTYGVHYYNQTGTKVVKIDATGAGIFNSTLQATSIGIGNTPSYLLDVYAATSATTSTMFRLKNGYNDPSTGIRMRWDFSSLPGVYLDVITDSGGSKSMYLSLSSANAAPTQVFQIVGSTGAATFSNSITSSGLNLNSGGVININTQNGFQLGADSASGGFYVYDNTNAVYRLKISNAGSTVLSGALTIGGAFSTGSPIYSSAMVPFTFTNNGNSATYTQTSIYINQNNTSGDTANGIFIERGKLSDSGAAETRQFIIGARGGSIQWRLDSVGNSFQTGFISATCTTSYNGDGVRVYASTTGGAGSQPGIGFWTAVGSKRFITQLDVSSDSWNVVNAAGSNWMTVLQGGFVGMNNTNPQARLDLGSGYGANGEKFFIYNDNNSSALAGTKVGFYMDRFGLANNSTYVFPTASAAPGSYVISSKDTGGTTLVARIAVFGETGFVGIGTGTSSISNRLQVSGNIYSTDTVYARNLKPEAWASVTAGSPSGAGIPYGYSSISISSLCDGNWRTILTNVNDTKMHFWASIGDAASKDTAQYFLMTTSPAYGVSNMGNINYQDNGWNTGSFDFQYINGGSGTYHLQVRVLSYYNSANTAYGNIYFLRME